MTVIVDSNIWDVRVNCPPIFPGIPTASQPVSESSVYPEVIHF
jgi:hypothetical protein